MEGGGERKKGSNTERREIAAGINELWGGSVDAFEQSGRRNYKACHRAEVDLVVPFN